ncbi:MAG: His-Xaa-Ser system protein HxsD [Elusimicrobiota bacterium]
MRFKVSLRSGEVVFPIQKKLYPLEIIQGAAYVLTDRAYAYVEEKRGLGIYELTLRSRKKATKEGLEALAGDFLNEVLNQALRQRLLADNRSVMEHIISRAMVSARRNDEDPVQRREAPDEALSAGQQAEMEKLIAEADAEIAARAKGNGEGDPRGIKRTWEERFGKPRAGR